MCPRSSDPFYVVTYYLKWVTTSWTYSILTILEWTRLFEQTLPGIIRFVRRRLRDGMAGGMLQRLLAHGRLGLVHRFGLAGGDGWLCWLGHVVVVVFLLVLLARGGSKVLLRLLSEMFINIQLTRRHKLCYEQCEETRTGYRKLFSRIKQILRTIPKSFAENTANFVRRYCKPCANDTRFFFCL